MDESIIKRRNLETVLTTTGDILIKGATVAQRLGIGSTNDVLTVAAGIPSWAAPTIQSIAVYFTRDMTAASGDVSYTGVGFAPMALTTFCNNGTSAFSFGMSGSSKAGYCAYRDNLDVNGAGGFLIDLDMSGGAYQYATVKTYDADGFTLTWVKGGSPTGTASLNFLAIR